ncbi:MAG: hypothetical protein JWN18_11 [Parcubacteria group bacterium]|nr:hypothetical protein [Parcubacteria group bacterium]
MSAEALLYPFLFLAIFFESFLLVTFLSKPARAYRNRAIVPSFPKVAIIVPCWNEESTVAGTVDSLLALEYPQEKLRIVLVNDGSTDGTAKAIEKFATHPQITTLHKENGGKFTAMNLALSKVPDAELVGFLDADSFAAPDSLREMVATFDSPEILAVTASMSIDKPSTLFQRMQFAEYSFAIILRHIFASINGLYVTPGPFSFYRQEVFTKLGFFKHAYLAEDMEMAMRIQRAGGRIGNAVRARVYTKGPPTYRTLIKQRTRWTTGFLRNMLFDYRDLIWSKRNTVLGMFVIPLGFLAIGGGIIVFALNIVELVRRGYHAVSLIQTVPVSYTFALHPFSWFYLPITALVVMGILVLASTVTWMVVGKKLSGSPGSLALNAVIYIVLYGVTAPIWLIRSVSDVARGVATTWR